METLVFGLNREQVVERARALAAEHATALDLPADASDTDLETAFAAVRDMVALDRKLRRPLRDAAVRSDVDAAVTWEVVVAAVGKNAAAARLIEWMQRKRTSYPSSAEIAEIAETVSRRPRRLPDAQVHPGLAEAAHAKALDDVDPMDDDGYETVLWLDEWLELAVGSEAFDGLEKAVAAHPLVDATCHEDREVFYVAAPTLHPEDVRQIVLAVLADTYDPDWES